MRNFNDLVSRKKVREEFLKDVEIPDMFKVKDDKPVAGYIYMIKDNTNSKVYIGKTRNLTNRAGDYVRAYLSGKVYKRIDKILLEKGIENFHMIPLAEYETDEIGIRYEKAFIQSYDSTNPEKGYNSRIASALHPKTRKSRIMHQDARIKMSKSKFMAAVSDNEIIFASGLKLFADYIGSKKDIIKNKARGQYKISGYFVIYLNPDDMQSQLDKVEKRRNKGNDIRQEIIERDIEFVNACDVIVDMMYSQIFINPGYKIKCLVQTDDNDALFEEISLLDFKKMI